MIIFYVDEAGDPNPFSVPLLDGQTPLFCLTGVAIDSSHWRELHRSLLALKRAYFKPEIAVFTQKYPTLRDHHFEVKGRELLKPSHGQAKRVQRFTDKVLDLALTLDARLFTVAWAKQANTDPMTIYTHSLQILAERFHHHARAKQAEGILVVDSRTHNLNFQVGNSHTSFLLGNPIGRTYTTLTEAPMFADSRLSGGVQFADILGALLYANYYQKRCALIPGAFLGNTPVTPQQYAANPAGWQIKTPARNYAHAKQFWPRLQALEFRRSDVAAPVPGGPNVPGYYGFREV
jgi:hypothetical protein